jgi:hypothetical protein
LDESGFQDYWVSSSPAHRATIGWMVGTEEFSVGFRGELTEAARGALHGVGVNSYFSGRTGGSVHHTVTVWAATQEAAVKRLREALRPHGKFADFSARPVRGHTAQ